MGGVFGSSAIFLVLEEASVGVDLGLRGLDWIRFGFWKSGGEAESWLGFFFFFLFWGVLRRAGRLALVLVWWVGQRLLVFGGMVGFGFRFGGLCRIRVWDFWGLGISPKGLSSDERQDETDGWIPGNDRRLLAIGLRLYYQIDTAPNPQSSNKSISQGN